MAFGRNRQQQPPQQQQFQSPYMYDPQFQRMFYEIEELNRKVANLNKRVRRLENYLQIRNEEIHDEDYYD